MNGSSLSKETLPVREVLTLPSGVWGDVEFFEILLEPPDFFTKNSPQFNAWKGEIVWTFITTPKRLPALLESAGLEAALVARSSSPSRLRVSRAGVEIRPTEEEILALTTENRAKLYPSLQESDVKADPGIISPTRPPTTRPTLARNG